METVIPLMAALILLIALDWDDAAARHLPARTEPRTSISPRRHPGAASPLDRVVSHDAVSLHPRVVSSDAALIPPGRGRKTPSIPF